MLRKLRCACSALPGLCAPLGCRTIPSCARLAFIAPLVLGFRRSHVLPARTARTKALNRRVSASTAMVVNTARVWGNRVPLATAVPDSIVSLEWTRRLPTEVQMLVSEARVRPVATVVLGRQRPIRAHREPSLTWRVSM